MDYLKVGKIVNTHGIKGELRLLSNFKYKNKIFKNNFKIYIGKEKDMEVINSYRVHKMFDMITLKGYSNINEVLKYKGKLVFIDKNDLVLNKDEYLDDDLIGFDVIYEDISDLKVVEIVNYPNNKLLKVRHDMQDNLVPFSLVDKIELDNKKIYVKDIKGLIK